MIMYLVRLHPRLPRPLSRCRLHQRNLLSNHEDDDNDLTSTTELDNFSNHDDADKDNDNHDDDRFLWERYDPRNVNNTTFQ